MDSFYGVSVISSMGGTWLGVFDRWGSMGFLERIWLNSEYIWGGMRGTYSVIGDTLDVLRSFLYITRIYQKIIIHRETCMIPPLFRLR